MTLKGIFKPNVATIDRHVDVAQAAGLMRREHVGDLVVTDRRDGHIVPIGVITDRDLVLEIIACDADPADITVGDMIRRDLLTVDEDNGVDIALRKMHRAGVRRAPVVDGSGTLIGVISIDDVIEHIASQLGEIAGTIRHQQEIESSQLLP
jgi:CBS domain-containing protein